ncbi:MAG: tetratricopeptide (TPR) repeat protein [Verrucomicrobiales bacterium]|jgi:tetratricopeptide (TPR) repeat protein
MAYKTAYAAISDLLFAGHSLSGRERNSLFFNTGNRPDGMPSRLANASFLTGFGVDDDTRGVATIDWDHDGDLDVWITNRTAPRLRLLRNELNQESGWLAVKLTGTTCNRDAIGARMTLTLPSGRKLYQTRRCGEGFLTQNSAWIHFGLGKEISGKLSLTVHWPDGKTETFADLAAGKRWQLRQGSSKPVVAAEQIAAPPLASGAPDVAPWEGQSRTALTARLPMPRINGKRLQEPTSKSSQKRGTLYVFAASWCQPCARELADLAKAAAQFTKAGIGIEVLAVPAPEDTLDKEAAAMQKLLKKVSWPFGAQVITAEQAGALDVFHRSFLSMRRPLPLPSSFLTDSFNQLGIIYRGPVTATTILADVPSLTKPTERIRAEDLPFRGQWVSKFPKPNIVSALVAWKREGYLKQGQRYLQEHLDRQANLTKAQREPDTQLALLCEHLVDFRRLQNDDAGVETAYLRALEFTPSYVPAMAALGNHYGRLGRITEAVPYLEKVLKLTPNSGPALLNLGVARVKQNQPKAARDLFLQAVQVNPRDIPSRINLLKMRIELKEWKSASVELLQLWRALPGNREVAALIPQILPNLPAAEQAKLKQDLQAAQSQR